MFGNAEDVLSFIEAEDVTVRFCDLPGVMQHVNVPAHSLPATRSQLGRPQLIGRQLPVPLATGWRNLVSSRWSSCAPFTIVEHPFRVGLQNRHPPSATHQVGLVMLRGTLDPLRVGANG